MIQPSTKPAGTLAEVRQKNIPAKKMHAISGPQHAVVDREQVGDYGEGDGHRNADDAHHAGQCQVTGSSR
jgi:hypothetical protein